MADRVRIIDACKNFGKVVALKNATLSVQPGEVVLVIGPSGSGKSTMLRCINRLEHLTSGEIWIDDDRVTDRASDMRKIREEVGMVFQSFNLFPHLTALQNITLAPRVVKRIPVSQATDAGKTLLARVGLSEKADVYPEQLSGAITGLLADDGLRMNMGERARAVATERYHPASVAARTVEIYRRILATETAAPTQRAGRH